jgi:hypothetical protein
MLSHGGGQFIVAGTGSGKDHVVHLLANASLCQAFNKLGLRAARPGPRADLAQTFFIDIDNDESAFVFVLSR